MSQLDLGHAELSPTAPLIAGDYTTITYTYTAGHPFDCAGYVKIAFRHMGDFGTPQFENPAAPNYCTVRTTGRTIVKPRWDSKGHNRPFNKALYLSINEEFLNRGEQIIVTFGDTSGGSPGWQVPTFPLREWEFRTLVDPIATFTFKQLPESPRLQVIAGKPVRAVCVAPSQVIAGQPFAYHLRLEDRWGNATGLPLRLEHPGFSETGVFTVEGHDPASGLSARSNPVEVASAAPVLPKFWADFHGQSGETIGSNTIEDYFTHGRDIGLVDILGHQGNDFEVTDAFWEKVNIITRDFYKPDQFVTFPGYEWSGNTPVGGDRNVYFASEGGAITRSSCELLPGQASQFPDSPTAKLLFKNLKQQKSPQPFVFAHVGGRYADLRMHDPDLELAVEIHSDWGTFEWFAREALALGYRVGFVANSDGHKADPGASYPGTSKFGAMGGLTCVLAERLNRESVVAALRARHFYATTGCRCLMDVSLQSGGKTWMMGDLSELQSGNPVLSVRLSGSAPIERVDVFNGLDLVQTLRPFTQADLGRRIKLSWGGSRVRGRDRAVNWDGSLKVSGNRIEDAVAVNFWNPDQPLRRLDGDGLTWKSFTTGAQRGVIMTLEDALIGRMDIETACIKASVEIAEIGMEGRTWDCGGLDVALHVFRLPDRQESNQFAFELPLSGLKQGDNPVYVRMAQEDGHLAWSSPIFIPI